MNANDVVNALLLDLVRSETHRLSLRPPLAHPLLLDRLRHLANLPPDGGEGTIELTVNRRPWQVTLSITPAAAGPQAELSARPAG